jgi:RNA polymerase sigma factor (sigma-70 family)
METRLKEIMGMANASLGKVVRHLRQVLDPEGACALSDADLLNRVVGQRDTAAFEVLVWRHGSMVLGLCRRLLRGHEHDAEDAFQATFLVLLRKAGSIGKRQALGSWLYKVAFRVALRLRARQHSRREQPSVEVPAREAMPELIWRDLRPVLDEEIHALPEKYRTPFILCYLEGLTNEEAAGHLGCPRGTVLSRLSWARQRLRDRLTRRGLALSAGALTAALASSTATAAPPVPLVTTTVNAAALTTAGKTIAGAVSAQAALLTQGVLREMFLNQMKIMAAVLLGIGVLTLGVGLFAAGGLRESPAGNLSGEARQLARADAPAKVAARHAEDEGAQKPVLVRVPNHGIQPQVAVDGRGVVHLVYFKGEPGAGDLFYTTSKDGIHFKPHPLRVNSQAGSAIAAGNIRGAHLALGKNGRVHVAWNGSDKARPLAPVKGRYRNPMLYTRLNDEGTAFEPQRNLITSAAVLDGGGSVAADDKGNVYVFWHAPEPGKTGEDNRKVWVAVSTDDGKTFAPERAASSEPTGACGCCGLRAFADSKGTVYTLYRGAKDVTQRDMYLLTSTDKGKSFQTTDVDPWKINICPMSSEAFAQGPGGRVVGAWETKGQVYFADIDSKTGKPSAPVSAPGAAHGRKHPAVAVNGRGQTILVWTDGMGWNKGGALAWQVYDKGGKPTAERGHAAGVPVWSLVAVFVRPDGRFAIVY